VKVTTKFNCGDDIFVLKDKLVKQMTIRRVTVIMENGSPGVRETNYTMHSDIYQYKEEQVFATKEELVASL
jgi:hypothetical protein